MSLIAASSPKAIVAKGRKKVQYHTSGKKAQITFTCQADRRAQEKTRKANEKSRKAADRKAKNAEKQKPVEGASGDPTTSKRKCIPSIGPRQKKARAGIDKTIHTDQCWVSFGLHDDDQDTGREWLCSCCGRWIH